MYEAIPKLIKISGLSAGNKFVKVRLKDGRTIECQADCFGETEIEDEAFVDDLRVLLKDGGSEILIEDDIEEVIG
ncbi:hypothetical protein [Proteiniborus sp.]|uniref:hypothetical protein n=1 Tax=Proteiniborus sp. TaxID=2079015 RepID=UPI003332B1FF